MKVDNSQNRLVAIARDYIDTSQRVHQPGTYEEARAAKDLCLSESKDLLKELVRNRFKDLSKLEGLLRENVEKNGWSMREIKHHFQTAEQIDPSLLKAVEFTTAILNNYYLNDCELSLVPSQASVAGQDPYLYIDNLVSGITLDAVECHMYDRYVPTVFYHQLKNEIPGLTRFNNVSGGNIDINLSQCTTMTHHIVELSGKSASGRDSRYDKNLLILAKRIVEKQPWGELFLDDLTLATFEELQHALEYYQIKAKVDMSANYARRNELFNEALYELRTPNDGLVRSVIEAASGEEMAHFSGIYVDSSNSKAAAFSDVLNELSAKQVSAVFTANKDLALLKFLLLSNRQQKPNRTASQMIIQLWAHELGIKEATVSNLGKLSLDELSDLAVAISDALESGRRDDQYNQSTVMARSAYDRHLKNDFHKSREIFSQVLYSKTDELSQMSEG